jgi:hypothetical protein
MKDLIMIIICIALIAWLIRLGVKAFKNAPTIEYNSDKETFDLEKEKEILRKEKDKQDYKERLISDDLEKENNLNENL